MIVNLGLVPDHEKMRVWKCLIQGGPHCSPQSWTSYVAAGKQHKKVFKFFYRFHKASQTQKFGTLTWSGSFKIAPIYNPTWAWLRDVEVSSASGFDIGFTCLQLHQAWVEPILKWTQNLTQLSSGPKIGSWAEIFHGPINRVGPKLIQRPSTNKALYLDVYYSLQVCKP